MAIIIDKKYEFNSGSDVYINVTKMTDREGTELDLSDAHFRLEFFDYEVYSDMQNCKSISDERKYIASYDGSTRINNSVVDGVLRIRLESGSIKRGRLYYRQIESYANAEFSDGSEDVVVVGYLDVMLSPVGGNTLPAGDIKATVSVGALKGKDYILTDADKQYIASLVNVPTKVSDLLNDSNFTTLIAVFAECYKKSETFTQSETESFVKSELAKLIDGAPEMLDTFKELADAVTNNKELVDALNEAIGLKLSKTEAESLYATITALSNYYTKLEMDNKLAEKVDKIAGKGLSTNDFTDELKARLEATMSTENINALIELINERLDTLVGSSTSEAIDTYNEIIAFLASFEDTDDLSSVLLALKNEIIALIPNVPSWALEATKPTYTASEVGALPDTTVIPSVEGLATEEYVDTKIGDIDTVLDSIINTQNTI